MQETIQEKQPSKKDITERRHRNIKEDQKKEIHNALKKVARMMDG